VAGNYHRNFANEICHLNQIGGRRLAVIKKYMLHLRRSNISSSREGQEGHSSPAKASTSKTEPLDPKLRSASTSGMSELTDSDAEMLTAPRGSEHKKQLQWWRPNTGFRVMGLEPSPELLAISMGRQKKGLLQNIDQIVRLGDDMHE
jgi:hypothetical protein